MKKKDLTNKKQILSKIKSKKITKPKHKIIIYGENWCPFCRNAKLLAKKITTNYKFVSGKSGLTLKKLLKSRNIPKTIPQIVVDGKHIGGFSNLQTVFMKINK